MTTTNSHVIATIETHPEDSGEAWIATVLQGDNCVFSVRSRFGEHPAYVSALSWCIDNGIQVWGRRPLDTGGGWNGS